MAVVSIGTPSPQRYTSGFTSAAGAWGASQNRAAGNLLVAVISGGNSSTANAWSVSELSSTWTQQLSVGNASSGASQCGIAVFTKTAAGSDAFPSFNTSVQGTGAVVVTLFEFSGANTSSPIDTTGTQQSGSSGVTMVFSVTTAGNVTQPGEYGISVFTQERGSSLLTWVETGTGWTSLYEDAVTSVSHTQINTISGPTSGSTLSDGGHFSTDTSAFGTGAIIVIAPTTVKQIAVTSQFVSVAQAGSSSIGVALASAPASSVTVTTAFTSGNSGLSISAGSSLTFTTGNWNVPQFVTFAADNASVGNAVFTATASGYPSVSLNVVEVPGTRPVLSAIRTVFP